MGKNDANAGQHEGEDAPAADAPLATAGAAILREQFAAMRSPEAGTRQGEDVEALHQMRVATRRLREAIRVFTTDDVRQAFAPLRATLSEIAQALGAVRDLDVFRDALRARAETNPDERTTITVLLDALEVVRTERRATLLTTLDAADANGFWDNFPTAIATLEHSTDPRVTIRSSGRRLLRRRVKKAVRYADEVRLPTTTELHAIRIRFKRLRYACEFFEPWFGRRVKPIVKLATGLQDTLGSLRECDVTPELLREVVGHVPPDREPAGVAGRDLSRAILALIQDAQHKRDELLVKFRDQLAELAKTKVKAL